MKVALGQINPIIGDFPHNTSLMEKAAAEAERMGCHLVVFPELSLVGYPPKDLVEKPSFVRDNMEALQALARGMTGIHALCGYVEKSGEGPEERLYNAVAFLGRGRVLATGRKRLLPTYDVFDEDRYFEPAGESLVCELQGLKLGVTLCEDIWKVGDMEGVPRYEVNPVEDLVRRGSDVLINVSASPFTLDKPRIRAQILQRISSAYNLPIAYCNQTGGNDELLFDGSSMVVDGKGRLVSLAREFEPDLLVWDTDERLPEIHWEQGVPEASVLKGLVMGTRDYVVKCGFKKALVGLSGGIDSALVAVIASRALGPENVMGVSMPSEYTSLMSRELARGLAENLGILFEEIPISGVFHAFKDSLSPLFEGFREDTTEENIQARVRGTLLMALSNKFNALLLATGNKSEMATGYCTLYGDMAGGLAVIADVPKTMCYRVARYINKDREVIPEGVITRPPSAELKPNQVDQDSLPPYELLDRILEAAVEKNQSPDDLLAAGYDEDTVRDIFRRLNVNEYKRRQAPPGLKVTTKAFGYGRRYPIARGGRDY